MSRDMKTSSADGGRKRWLAWYAPVAAANRVAAGRVGRRAVGARRQTIRGCAAGVLLAAALAAAGCGAAGNGRRLEQLDRSRLSSQLSEVRDAAGRGDRSAARQALDDFTAEVRRLRRAGALDGPTAGALLLGAQRARSQMEVELAPPVQAPPAQPAPQSQPRPPQQPKPGKQQPQKHKDQDEKEEKKGASGGDKGHKDAKKH
jgi:hypothetical protein